MIWSFKPTLFSSVITIILLALFIRLGFWQLDRAVQRDQIFDKQQLMLTSAPEKIKTLSNELLTEQVQRKIEVSGRFIGPAILLDSQSHQGKAGYHVYTPFLVSEDSVHVLVNMGWIAAGQNRQEFPDIEIPSGSQTIMGIFMDVPFSGIKLGETIVEELSESLFRVQHIETEKLADIIGQPLHSKVLRLEPEAESSYVRDWLLQNSGADKNRAYALQWFSFAIVLFIIFIILNTRKKT